MKTPILKRRVSLLFFQAGISFLFVSCLLTVFGSCDDDKDYQRKEFIIVSESMEKAPVKNVYCKIEGGKDTLYVFSNVEYKYFFQTDDDDEEWVKIISTDYLSDIEATRLIFEVSPRGNNYLKRTGTLSVSSGDNFLGHFVPFNQGFNTRLKEDFSWLKYGSANPLDASKEEAYEKWTEAQQKMGWESTPAEDFTQIFCYGKNGYVRLGSETGGADIISPYTNGIVNDTVLLLTFDAVAYVSDMGIKDNNKLTVNILNGGLFADGSTSVSVDLGYYDHTDKNIEKNMWENSRYMFYIKNNETKPLTGDTRMQFVTGEDIATGSRNRLFIDNVNLFVIDGRSHYLADLNNMP